MIKLKICFTIMFMFFFPFFFIFFPSSSFPSYIFNFFFFISYMKANEENCSTKKTCSRPRHDRTKSFFHIHIHVVVTVIELCAAFHLTVGLSDCSESSKKRTTTWVYKKLLALLWRGREHVFFVEQMSSFAFI